jgi:hypothetical protein
VATTTWDSLRDKIAEPLGLFVCVTDVGSDITSGLTFVSDDLQERFTVDDYFNGWFARFQDDSASSSNAGKIRKVKDYAAATGTVTVAGENLASASGTTTVALHRLHPDDLRKQFNQARLELFPHLGVLRDTRMVTGQQQYSYDMPSTTRGAPLQVWLGTRDAAEDVAQNQFTDGGFESWTNATTLASWSLTGSSASVNQETETTTPKNYSVFHDTYSARVYSASSGTTTLMQVVTPSQGTQSMEANLSVWVYCTSSARVSARMETANGLTHGGTGWELLTMASDVGATGTTITAGIHITAGTRISVYVDEAILVVGQSREHERAWTPLHNWRWMPHDFNVATTIQRPRANGVLEFSYSLPEKRQLRIITRDLLTEMTADSSEVELDGENLLMIMDKTRELAARTAARWSRPTEEREFWEAEEARYRQLSQARMNTSSSVPWPKRRLNIPDWVY